MKSRRHVAPLPWQLAQQLLRNAYDVVFTVIKAGRGLLVRTSPIDALESGMTSFEIKRRCRRLVNDSVFADRKLGTTGVAIPCS